MENNSDTFCEKIKKNGIKMVAFSLDRLLGDSRHDSGIDIDIDPGIDVDADTVYVRKDIGSLLQYMKNMIGKIKSKGIDVVFVSNHIPVSEKIALGLNKIFDMDDADERLIHGANKSDYAAARYFNGDKTIHKYVEILADTWNILYGYDTKFTVPLILYVIEKIYDLLSSEIMLITNTVEYTFLQNNANYSTILSEGEQFKIKCYFNTRLNYNFTNYPQYSSTFYVYTRYATNCITIDNKHHCKFAECLRQKMQPCSVILLTDNLDKDGEKIPKVVPKDDECK